MRPLDSLKAHIREPQVYYGSDNIRLEISDDARIKMLVASVFIGFANLGIGGVAAYYLITAVAKRVKVHQKNRFFRIIQAGDAKAVEKAIRKKRCPKLEWCTSHIVDHAMKSGDPQAVIDALPEEIFSTLIQAGDEKALSDLSKKVEAPHPCQLKIKKIKKVDDEAIASKRDRCLSAICWMSDVYRWAPNFTKDDRRQLKAGIRFLETLYKKLNEGSDTSLPLWYHTTSYGLINATPILSSQTLRAGLGSNYGLGVYFSSTFDLSFGKIAFATDFEREHAMPRIDTTKDSEQTNPYSGSWNQDFKRWTHIARDSVSLTNILSCICVAYEGEEFDEAVRELTAINPDVPILSLKTYLFVYYALNPPLD